MSNQNLEQLIKNAEMADSAKKLWLEVKEISQLENPLAIPFLIKALSYNNPGAAVAAVDGLIKLGEMVVEPLLKDLDWYNYTARAWGIRVFAGIGDPRGLELLNEAASSDFSLSVRRAAARGLGKINWSKLPVSKVPSSQKQTLDTLLLASEDIEWVVRYSVVVGLQLLGTALKETQTDWFMIVEEKLQKILDNDQEIAVKARAKLALEKLTKLENTNK